MWRPVIRIVLFISLVLVSSSGTAPGQQASASLAKPNAAPTPIPLAKVALEAQSALASLQEIDASVSKDQSSSDGIARTLLDLTNEIDARIAGDTRLLTTSPSIDLRYFLKLTWQDFGDSLLVSARELTQHATSLEEQLARLDQLNKTWQATLQAAKQPDTPPAVLQSVQSVVDSVERTRQAAEFVLAHVLTLQSRLSEEEARVRTVLSSIEQVENHSLKILFVRDSPPIWSLETSLGAEWEKQSGEAFSSQLKASTAFTKRLPFTFLIHALFIVLIATALQWIRRRIRKLTEQKPDLSRALPILDLPVSTAFALSILIVPLIYAQAPRLIITVMGTVTLIPTVVILRRLLERDWYPILNTILIMYFLAQLRVLAGSLPVLARFIFLGQMLGFTIFLVWVLRSWHLPTGTAATHGRGWRTIRAIAKIGLILLPAALLANIFGYVNLGDFLGIIFLRSVYVSFVLYSVIRIIEGLIAIALQVRPLGSLRVISLHRPMLERRTCRVLEFLAFLLWLNLVLSFFGLLTPLMATIEAVLQANLIIGSLNISLGQVLLFTVTVWASFLVSKFLRFLLEEDVYHRLHLGRGIPQAISTIIHYAVLLLGFFVALAVLGVDLTKVTILAGAFTVGVGFGLQTVINNFVCGLILLFERPIKVGDVVQVDTDIGEVRRIGIRACVIRTADGSEVIVPNGTIISNKVTNWTFSDRYRAVEVPVSVARGVDPERVVELLKSVAANNPSIAKEPAPQAYIVNLAPGAVSFQLRAWTDRYEDWVQVRSDLSLAVDRALTRENILIA
jgi:potassium-dependent mechanosensitive channel